MEGIREVDTLSELGEGVELGGGVKKGVVTVIPYTFVDPMTIDISDLTVDGFLARPYLWKPRVGGGITYNSRGIANYEQLTDWVHVNLKEISEKATLDHPFANDPAHAEFLEALDRAD